MGESKNLPLDGRAFAARLIEDPEYLESLKRRAIAGTLDPVIEEMLLYYGFSTPPPRQEPQLRLIA